ncbi:MAG TPA: PBP1A family penicillin-binding protein [Desulfomonilaceae bacterium]|nr:PBP1A family penicillin-binding protein [Desulfomonilaceae bacterium]
MKTFFRTITGKILFWCFFLIPLAILVEIPIFLLGVGLGTYLVFSRDLPEIPPMLSYQPRTVSTFYADDGTVIGVFYKEKRYVVDLPQIPTHVKNAFLASEDSHFFEHHGVDWLRIAAAMVRNVKALRVTQGGSTITMQVTRNFLLSRERRLSRKIKEMILAERLEKAWGKEKILHVYLNEIYLGEACYGVEAAARGYFDKPVEHLSLAEAALIAGLVAGPARFNPYKSEELARQKQVVVLGRMLRAGFITQDEYDKAKAEQLTIRGESVHPFDLVPDFAEAVRRYVLKKYGEEKLLNEGLKVFTTCKLDYQRKAVESLEKGLDEIKARLKHIAILNTVPKEEIPELLQRRATPELHENKQYQGVVTRVTHRKTKDVVLDVALSKRLAGQVRLDRGGGVYKVGHVVALRFDKFVDDVPTFVLDTDPKLEGAFLCIENRTGFVRALVGGTSGDRFKFNRAIQAKRQPGSAFKPIIYSVAMEEKSYSPATIIVDEPIVVDFDREDVEWEPRNAGGNFLGPLSLRRALELSRNICTIKILMDVGFDPVIEMAHKMGITSELGRNLSLSLGTSELSLFELTSAYTVFPNSGIHVEPVLVKRVEDRFGNVLEDNSNVPLLDEAEIPKPTPREEFADDSEYQTPQVPAEKWKQPARVPPSGDDSKAGARDRTSSDETGIPESNSRVKPAMSPQTAYIMTSLLQGGVRQGTGARMTQYLKRKDLAGKTGTTNKAADTWFIGFNPDYTAGVWVGFDEKRPLGDREEGARAALPIWGYFMKSILENKPERDFPVPPELTFKDMLTFTGNPTQGFVPKMVREPVYTPFVGKTLVLWPQDTPQTLAQYRGVILPGITYDQAAYGASPPGQTGGPVPLYPGQPGAQPPVHPMDGRNLFPETVPHNPHPPAGAVTGEKPGGKQPLLQERALQPPSAPNPLPQGLNPGPSPEARPRPIPPAATPAPNPR